MWNVRRSDYQQQMCVNSEEKWETQGRCDHEGRTRFCHRVHDCSRCLFWKAGGLELTSDHPGKVQLQQRYNAMQGPCTNTSSGRGWCNLLQPCSDIMTAVAAGGPATFRAGIRIDHFPGHRLLRFTLLPPCCPSPQRDSYMLDTCTRTISQILTSRLTISPLHQITVAPGPQT